MVCRRPLGPSWAPYPQMHPGQPQTLGGKQGRHAYSFITDGKMRLARNCPDIQVAWVVGQAGAQGCSVQHLPAEESLDGGRPLLEEEGGKQMWAQGGGRSGGAACPSPSPCCLAWGRPDKPDPACHPGGSLLPWHGLSRGPGHGQKGGRGRMGALGLCQPSQGKACESGGYAKALGSSEGGGRGPCPLYPDSLVHGQRGHPSPCLPCLQGWHRSWPSMPSLVSWPQIFRKLWVCCSSSRPP